MKSRERWFNQLLELNNEELNKIRDEFGDEIFGLCKKMYDSKIRLSSKTEEQLIHPDIYGCDSLFVKDFLTPKMEQNFLTIANEFLKHEYCNLKEYNELEYKDTNPAKSSPIKSLQYMILNLMLVAANKGNENARSLFCYLYKVYYKKEYNVLKRFKILSSDALFDVLSKDDSEYVASDVIYDFQEFARPLKMATFMGIELDDDTNYLWDYLTDIHHEVLKREENKIITLSEEIWSSVKEEVFKHYPTDEQLTKDMNKVERYISKVLGYLGYPNDYLKRTDKDFLGYRLEYERAVALYKKAFPNKEIIYEHVHFYVAILHCLSALTNICNSFHDNIQQLLGIYEGGKTDSPLSDMQIENSKWSNKSKSSQKQNRPVNETAKEEKYADEEIYVNEIRALRERLHREENNVRHMREELQEQERRIRELELEKKRNEEERQELIALREHVYHFTDYDIESEKSISIDEMKAEIRKKNIILIGGHKNWIHKMQLEFPKWTYISPNVTGTVNKHSIIHGDFVYFFTDVMGHSTYYRYVQILREHNVKFGYIHGVNLNANIRQIYTEQIKKVN